MLNKEQDHPVYDYGYECLRCGSTERTETDIEPYLDRLKYHYTCKKCGMVWVVTERKEN